MKVYTRSGFSLKQLKRECITRIRKSELGTGRAQFIHKCKKIFLNNQKEIWKCNRNFQVVKMIAQICSKESSENVSYFWFDSWSFECIRLIFLFRIYKQISSASTSLNSENIEFFTYVKLNVQWRKLKIMSNRHTTCVSDPN